MTAIWQSDGTEWRLLPSAGFPSEAALHDMVERAPQMLPLAGEPRLAVVGREVLLGGNYADLIALEANGRVAIIEIKLARNAEARRAVVAQVLTYAAYLRGMDPVTFARDVLGSHLDRRGQAGLSQALADADQVGTFDAVAFDAGLAESLRDGRFRLVLVLDEAPAELVRLVGYLGAVADKLLSDLITVAAYAIGGSQVVIPRRVDPEREPPRAPPASTSPAAEPAGAVVRGKDAFLATVAQAAPEHQPLLRQLVSWAADLEREGIAQLWTYLGKSGRTTLLPYIPGENAGLVTIWNDNGPYLSLWRSVFERRAPDGLARIEQMPNAPKVGQGNTVRAITDRLLDELTTAYREAAGGRVSLDPPVAAAEF